MAFPLGDRDIRIGILGYTEGNGHPYSWSAMFNGYDKTAMADCPLPPIPAYLSKQPRENFGVPGAKVICVCCTGFEGRERAEHIARASLIPEVVDDPREMLGKVDAVIVATDVGAEHVQRCRPFIEAGIPLFIDKPMVDNEEDLKTFLAWRKAGAKFLTSSAMRFAGEYTPYHQNYGEVGKLTHITSIAPCNYEKYGIHALEAMYPFLGPGFVSVRNTGSFEKSFVHIKHARGCDVHVTTAFDQMVFGVLLTGSVGAKLLRCTDSYYAFRTQLQKFVHWLRTGEEPFPFAESVELMKLVIAGIRSREEGGREVYLSEILREDNIC